MKQCASLRAARALFEDSRSRFRRHPPCGRRIRRFGRRSGSARRSAGWSGRRPGRSRDCDLAVACGGYALVRSGPAIAKELDPRRAVGRRRLRARDRSQRSRHHSAGAPPVVAADRRCEARRPCRQPAAAVELAGGGVDHGRVRRGVAVSRLSANAAHRAIRRPDVGDRCGDPPAGSAVRPRPPGSRHSRRGHCRSHRRRLRDDLRAERQEPVAAHHRPRHHRLDQPRRALLRRGRLS